MRIIKGFEQAKSLLARDNCLIDTFVPLKRGSIERTVRNIIKQVQIRRNEALFGYTREFDGADLSSLEITNKEIAEAYKNIDTKLNSALTLAAKRIEEFHTKCAGKLQFNFYENELGRQVNPLDKVGIYVPGGTAAYPSTVLMTVIPAKVAGVREIILVTPPRKDGSIPAATLVAADIAKVNRVFKVGGAQAIAALAFGTETIPRVDKICGPGNIYIITAKKMVYGVVDIESLPGPSEIVIVADEYADPSFCAADLIAQAEHDAMASAILITTSSSLAEEVKKEISTQLKYIERTGTVKKAIRDNGMIVTVDTVVEAIELVNIYAPEHVSLMLRDAEKYTTDIRRAGCIFIGENCPVALGDYILGPSHVLPTGGTARFNSPLRVEDFLKITNVAARNNRHSIELEEAAITIAEAEGLSGHAKAIKIRLQRNRVKSE
jgi:histidinol dehydrogenase